MPTTSTRRVVACSPFSSMTPGAAGGGAPDSLQRQSRLGDDGTLSPRMEETETRPRQVILDRISGARSEKDVSEARKAADRYLEEHPYDPDVIAAREKLERRASRLKDPERRDGW